MLSYFRLFFSSEATAEAEMVEPQLQQEIMDTGGMGACGVCVHMYTCVSEALKSILQKSRIH